MSSDNTYIHWALTRQIIACAKTVYHRLGCGFFEKLYENAVAIELERAGLSFKQQCDIAVRYDDIIIGEYVADFLVNGLVILELKAVSELSEVHETQVLNYLRATGHEVGLLINFGNKFQVRRKAYQTAKNRHR